MSGGLTARARVAARATEVDLSSPSATADCSRSRLSATLARPLLRGELSNHFTDSRELYVLVEGDEGAHVEALDPDAGYWARRFAQLVNWRARGEKAVIEPSSLQRRNSSSSSKDIARLRAEGALTESEFEAVKARLLSDEAAA